MSPELSLAPEPEQSQDRMDSCSQGTLDELLVLFKLVVGTIVVILGTMVVSAVCSLSDLKFMVNVGS